MQRLVQNEISRPEFEELLEGLEDSEMLSGMEESMRKHFDKVLKDYKNDKSANSENHKTSKLK
ncbi:hypothetical protein Q4534_15325 [Cyclobacterium sp. 1_MG-2023]|nr:hypothetical protein [Cyclobacterium sp. 1_MG-2023]